MDYTNAGPIKNGSIFIYPVIIIIGIIFGLAIGIIGNLNMLYYPAFIVGAAVFIFIGGYLGKRSRINGMPAAYRK